MTQNKYFQHEAVDRINMIVEIINDHLLEQPMIKHTPELEDLVNQATELLNKAYQSAALMDDVTDSDIYAEIELRLS